MTDLFGGPIEQLRQGVVFANRRHELLAQNVANAEVPGFRARDLNFHQELTLAQQVRAQLSGVEGATDLDVRLVDSPDEPRRPDGNTVDIDRQMTRLAENTLYQHTLIQLLNARFRGLKTAINGHP